MTRNVTIESFGDLKTISLIPEIKSIKHYSNQRELFDYLLTKKYKDFDLKLEQRILIEFEIKISAGTGELILKYQSVLERSYDYFSVEFSNGSESYKKFIVRLTSLSVLQNNENKTLFELVIRLLESQNDKVRIITSHEFFNFDVNSLLQFELETSKFGLFICPYHHSYVRHLVERGEFSFENDKSETIKKIILSTEFPNYNTYVVSLFPSPTSDLLEKALPPIDEGFKSNMSYRGDIYENRNSHAFLEGTYDEVKTLFENEDALRKIVIDYVRQELHKNASTNSESIEDSIDWTSWNDSLDTDQQSEDYWNQF